MIRSVLSRVGIALALLVAGLAASAGIYTDWLWFANLGYQRVYAVRLLLPWVVRIGLGLVVALFFWVNLQATRPAVVQAFFRRRGGLPEFLTGRRIGWFLAAASLVLGFLYSAGLATQWQTILLAFYGGSFGVTEPLFGRDAGFYVFRLPFLHLLVRALLGLVALALAAAGVVYFLAGAFELEGLRLQLAPRAKWHLSLLLIGAFLLKAWDYRLATFDLLYSERGAVFGPSYVDVHAVLPGLRLLTVLALVAAAAVLVNLFRPGTRLILGSVVLLLGASAVAGGIYPALVQRFVVNPNELARERPFIENHIALTNQAFALDRIAEAGYASAPDLSYQKLQAFPETLHNIRLWDYRPLQSVYGQLQEFRLYYDFGSVDVDRYRIDGQYRQVFLAARELSADQLRNPTWVNRHLQYTHGYGLVMSPVNEVNPEGLPTFLVANIPPASRFAELEVTRPQIYFGERTDTYVIVGTRTPEFDHPRGDENAFTRYEGRSGVSLGSPLRRLAFTLRFGDLPILLSRELTGESRILFRRNIRERVEAIAPFFRYDPDPYLVVAGGRLFWILDAYVATNRFPYAAPVAGWGNYVRNPVKVVVDAYHGDVTFYQVEAEPITEAWSRVFPGLIRPVEEMPPALAAHIRYPEQLLLVQAAAYAIYHMKDPTVFYNQEDVWAVAQEIVGEEQRPMEPYYTIMDLPGGEEAEFVLLLPFTPLRKNNMVAWLAARSDPPHYGTLQVFKFPKDSLTFGPLQVEARIDQDPLISQQITLWSQRGSRVNRGNLLVIPVADSILYVEPLFLQAENSSLPELRRVIVAYADRVAMGANLDEALRQLFGEAEAAARPPDGRPAARTPAAPGAPALEGTVAELVEAANQAFQRATAAQRAGDWAGYGQALADLQRLLERLRELTRGGALASPSP